MRRSFQRLAVHRDTVLLVVVTCLAVGLLGAVAAMLAAPL